ncbi:MAG: hypothetical protein R2795_00005, partial [Saprospiraceae bacterium]
MKYLFFIVTLTAITIQMLSLPFLALQLEVNREELALPMCVNADKPALACFGSCYIVSELSAAMQDQQDTTTNSLLKTSFLTVYIPTEVEVSFLSLNIVEKDQPLFSYLISKGGAFQFIQPMPPQLLA